MPPKDRAAYAREWRKKNPEKSRSADARRRQSERYKRWVEKYGNRKRELARLKRWQEENRPRYLQSQKYWRNKSPRGRFKSIRHGARARGLSFDIIFQDFMKFWQKPCAYCGGSIDTIGLDRINNDLGYSMDNIVSSARFATT